MRQKRNHAAPLELRSDVVRPEWIDYNGHMNVAYYVLAFDYATDDFLDYVGLDAQTRSAHHLTTFAAEAHVLYLQELPEAAPIRITTQLLAYDRKRIHYFHRMFHGSQGYLAATTELLSLIVDSRARRVTTMPDFLTANLADLLESHAALARPDEVGRTMGIPA